MSTPTHYPSAESVTTLQQVRSEITSVVAAAEFLKSATGQALIEELKIADGILKDKFTEWTTAFANLQALQARFNAAALEQLQRTQTQENSNNG